MNRVGNVLESRFVFFQGLSACLRGLALRLQSSQSFPQHESRNGNVDNDRDNAYDKVHVARALQHLNELRATFGAADRAKGHDQSEFKIDIAERAVSLRRHD